MEQTKYTVFFKSGFLTSGDCRCHSLRELIDVGATCVDPPLMWAPVYYWTSGKDQTKLRAESIAAGRVIELVDGQYVPRGVPVETKPAATLSDQLRKVLERGKPTPTPTLDKLENEAEKKEEAETLINGLTAEETDATASVAGIFSKTPLADLRDLVAIQGMDGTWNTDEYMLGLFNGLEMALATMEGRDPQYRTLKPTAPAVPASTAKPALAALSRISSMSHMLGNGIREEIR